MANFDQTLTTLLKQDKRFVDKEDHLIKSVVIDKALKTDKTLIERLLSNTQVKKKFFLEIKKHWVFNASLFVDFIQDKNFLIDSYTKFRNKIGLNIDGKYLNERGEITLVWPFKDCVLEGGMRTEENKREEIFFNEVLAQDEIDRLLDPKVLTNGKYYTAKGEKKFNTFTRDQNGTIKDNLIIKGNNLLALHSIKKQFAGKVKLIYIDPPYNTEGEASTFTYNNNFNHSTWLTFMENRLTIGRDMLKDDGFIAIAIDHYELGYLITLGDEIFGRENGIGIISVLHHPAGRTNDTFFATTNEYMLVYCKNKELAKIKNFEISKKIEKSFNHIDEISKYKLENIMRKGETRNARREDRPKQFYPIYVDKDLKGISLNKNGSSNQIKLLPIENSVEWIWSFSPSTLQKKIDKKEIIVKKNNGKTSIFFKRRIIDYKGRKPRTTWDDKKYNSTHYGTMLLEKIIGRKSFSYPKSLYTVLDTLKIMTSDDDIILDFFAGSGTTGHATLELNKEDDGNRQFILVEQMDYINDTTVPRVQKVMEQNAKNSFIYLELKKHNEMFINSIQSAKSTKKLEEVWEAMKENSFLNWNVDLRKQVEAFKEWKKLSFKEQQRALVKLLDKNQLYVNYSEMDDEEFKCTAEEKKLSKNFYQN